MKDVIQKSFASWLGQQETPETDAEFDARRAVRHRTHPTKEIKEWQWMWKKKKSPSQMANP